MTILVAGRREELGRRLVPLLMKKGHALLFAATCEQLLRMLRTEQIDLIILDLELPTDAGLGAVHELEPELEAISIPVLVVGQRSYVRPSVRELTGFLRRNAVAILDKPVDFLEIDREIGRLCGGEVQAGCCLTESTLTQLADGELVEEEAARARRHLSECGSCKQLFDECEETDSLLRDFFRRAMMLRMAVSDECLSRGTLAAYCRDGLSPPEREEIEAHLAACSYCTRELVAFHNLMRECGEEQLEPLSEEVLNTLKQRVTELLRNAGSLICIRCFKSIPLDSTACPQCGAAIQSRVQGASVDGPAQAAAREDSDEERKKVRPNGSRGMRKGQVAASLLGLSLIASAALIGSAIYRNQGIGVRPGTTFVMRLEASVEEEIEVFERLAMFSHEPLWDRVPENVEQVARALIEQHYYDGSVAEQALRRGDIRDVFETLNRLETKGSRSLVLPKLPNRIMVPDEVMLLKDELANQFTGIGISVKLVPEGEKIRGFTADSLAEEAGLQVGDIILEVDGVPIRGLSLVETTILMRGLPGTRVTLKVARDGVPDFEVALQRQKKDVPAYEVNHEILEGDVAYVRVSGLTRGLAERVEDVLSELENSPVRKLVLDLRGNTGGSMETAADIAAFLLPEGTLVARVYGRERERRLYAEGKALWNGRLAILTDGETMSGAELVGAALRCAERGTIIGERSAGKGSVQTIYRLTNGYAVQLTTGVLSCADGFIFNNRGVEPDIEVVAVGRSGSRLDFRDESEDIALKAALESLM